MVLVSTEFFLWLHWVFIAAHKLFVVSCGILSICGERASCYGGFSCCGAWALGCLGFSSYGAQVQLPCGFWDLSPWTRDQTCVPYIGRQIRNHWTRGSPTLIFLVFSVNIPWPLKWHVICLLCVHNSGKLKNTQNPGQQQMPSSLQVSAILPSRTAITLNQWEQHLPQKHPVNGAFAEEMCWNDRNCA